MANNGIAAHWLYKSPEDEVPKKRDGILGMHEEEHYITGNERTLDLFHPHIADVRGGRAAARAHTAGGRADARLAIRWNAPHRSSRQESA